MRGFAGIQGRKRYSCEGIVCYYFAASLRVIKSSCSCIDLSNDQRESVCVSVEALLSPVPFPRCRLTLRSPQLFATESKRLSTQG